MKTSNIKRIRIIYSLFAGILLICLGLFLFNVISAAEQLQMAHLGGPKNNEYAFSITDLHADTPLFAQEHAIDSLPSGYRAHAHVSRFTADFYGNLDKSDPRIMWVTILQWFNSIAFVSIIVLAVIVLISFYRSAQKGHVFPKKQVTMLSVIGLLILISSITGDTSSFIERTVASDLLQGSAWQPQVLFEIHMGRIFFGLTLIFISQIFRIGYEMQEEQEYTI